MYDTSLGKTLSNLQRNKGVFKIEKTDNGDIIWNGFPVENLGGNKLKLNEDVYNKNDNL